MKEDAAHGGRLLGAVLGCALAATLMVGCRVPAEAVEGRSPLRAAVTAEGTGQVIGGETAARLKMGARFDHGMALLKAGRDEEGLAMLRSVRKESKQRGIELPEEMREQLDKVLAGEWTPPREEEPAAEEAPAQEGPETAAAPPRPELPPFDPVRMPALVKPGMADKPVSLDFDQVDIRLVLKTVSDLTGVNFLVHGNVAGTVTLMSPTEIRLGEIFDVLNSILAIEGFAAIPAGNLVKIVPRPDAGKHNLPTRYGSDPADIPQDDGVVTQIMPLRYVRAGEISGWVTASVTTGSQVTTVANTNALIVTGTSSNIHQIAKLVQQMDVPGAAGDLEVIRLEYAAASELARQLMEILEERAAAPAAPGRPAAGPGAGGVRKVLADLRTNSLIVIAEPGERERVRELVERLDVERPLTAGNVHVVRLQHADAEEMVQSLSGALEALAKTAGEERGAPIQVAAQVSTNSLIVTASAQDYAIIADIISKLDTPREQVLVEMTIMEAGQEAVEELGVEWATLTEPGRHLRGFGDTDFGVRIEELSGTLEGLSIGAFELDSAGRTRIAAILHALERDSRVNILSKPHVLTSNNQEAKIVVAENVPFVQQSRITETDPATPTTIRTFDFKDVGIEMTITPHLSAGGQVRLEIASSFSQIIESATGLGPETPTTAKREAETTVSVTSGSTVVIGGLMRDDEIASERKVPLLGDVPLLGALFRRTRQTSQKTNLLIFITPHVLTLPEDMEDMTARKQVEAGMEPGARRMGRPR